MRDDGSLVVQLQDGLAPDVHRQGVDARNVVGHARVSRLAIKTKARAQRHKHPKD